MIEVCGNESGVIALGVDLLTGGGMAPMVKIVQVGQKQLL
jgi:hypothetical protein